jgi:signal transduction histidine kinase
MDRPDRARLARLTDVCIPAGLGIFMVAVVTDPPTRPSSAGLTLVAVSLAVVQAAALWWRRRRPVEVTLVVLASGVALQLLAPEIVVPFAGLFAVGALAAACPPRVSLAGLAGLVGISAINYATATAADASFTIGIAVGAWALGESARSHRVALAQEARRASSEEQARISRELHDVIAHTVSVIVVQAAAADDVFDSRPDQARAALRSIESAGRDALQELRRVLAVVRPGPATGGGPRAGLARLDDLATPLRSAGLDVVVRREGTERPLGAELDLSAYRIVQEALTNTLRHSGAARVEVALRYRPGMLEIDVADDGCGASTGAGGGHGLPGMRERAAVLGGTLDAGPRPEGGYRVRARLPTGAGR